MITINFTLSYFEIYFIVINLVAFTFYTYDKIQAYKNTYRVSEKKLLFIAFVGGSVGSLISMLLLRHKIKKKSFMIKFVIVIILQIVAIYFYITQGFNYI